MTDFLVFTIAAALGACGDLAGHERRGSAAWPGRSAVLGLIASALGIRRDEIPGLEELDTLAVTVSVIVPGEVLRDYHTVQTVPATAVRNPASRRAALADSGSMINTIVTLRDYRTGPVYSVAVAGDEISLCRIEKALKHPTFVLYLGRKCCPLSAPVAPRRVNADNAMLALAEARMPPWIKCDPAKPRLIATDPGHGIQAGNYHERVETRHDRVVDPKRRHFGARSVHILTEKDE